MQKGTLNNLTFVRGLEKLTINFPGKLVFTWFSMGLSRFIHNIHCKRGNQFLLFCFCFCVCFVFVFLFCFVLFFVLFCFVLCIIPPNGAEKQNGKMGSSLTGNFVKWRGKK